jgi:hypothetical protein
MDPLAMSTVESGDCTVVARKPGAVNVSPPGLFFPDRKVKANNEMHSPTTTITVSFRFRVAESVEARYSESTGIDTNKKDAAKMASPSGISNE